MKIKNQFIICIAVFSIILTVIAGSVATTELQVNQLNAKKEISNNIERGASSLNSVSIDYFLYQEDLQLSRWQSTLSSLSSDLSSLQLNGTQHQTFIVNVANDLQRLNSLFSDVVSYLQTASRNVSVRIDPAFQLRWSSLAVQSQALAFDASQLSRSLDDQAHQVNDTNTLLVVSLVGAFGAFLATIYLMVFRRTLKSVAELQNGINTIGSGNLDYAIKTEGQNESTELSNSFNQMTANLKTVTSTKTELEREIAGRKQAETSLRESEQRWATTLASIGDAVIATDLSGKVMFMNGVAEELTGWTMSEASLRPVKGVFNIVNEQTRAEVDDPVSKVLEKGLIVGLANHTVLIRKDGTEVAIDDSGAPIKDKDGNVTGVVLIFRDITERKKNEEKINQQALMIANTNDAIIGYDLDQRVTFWNKAAEQMYGYSTEEATGKISVELLKPAYVNITREELVNRISSTGHVETESIRSAKDGRKLNVEAHVILLRNEAGKPMGYVSADRDITERKKAEDATKRQASLIDLSPDAIIIRTLEGTITFWNKGAEKLYGWTMSEAVGQISQTLLKTVFPKTLNDIVPQVKKYGRWSGELRHKTKDGRNVIVQSWWLAEKDEQGEVNDILESNIDITERKQIENKLEEYTRNLEGLVEERTKKLELSSLYARSLIEASLDPLVTISAEGKITDVNKATEQATGCSREELIDSDFSDYFVEPEKAKIGYKQVFTEGFVRDYPLAIKHKSGKITDVLYNATVYRNEAGEVQGVFAAARDITQRKSLEKQLKDSERLAAIGATAGMVGHDIRNPLQSITSDVYLAKTDLASTPDSEEKKNIQESLTEIEKNIYYINKIVADLQDFARPLSPRLEKIDLEQTIHLVLANLNIPGNVTVKHSVKKGFPKLRTDQSYIQRILTNLSTNAIQAMPNGGKLTIAASSKNGKATITVEDTGEGIPEEVRGKLFTPLVSTKSKGQGFGLAVVKRFTEGLGGTVTFESEVGKGTKFTIELPT